ncbi:MAG: hypothetical protein V7641_855 [Blastocatellia bacterium]
MATRTDIRGVVTTYTHDTLNRLTQVSYNTVSGVTTAPTVTYIYDQDSGTGYSTTAMGELLRVNVGSDYQERYTFDSSFRIASSVQTIGTRNYTTSYNSYNEANQLTQMTYPSGQLLYIGHDSTGIVSSLANYPSGSAGTDYVSGHSHNIAGQVSSNTYGNGVTEQFGYDAARMQMTSQKAGTTSPYTNRMDLTYSYNAQAGQMGVNTTAGNAGQLTGVLGTINGTTESATYYYDNLARLKISLQTSNGQSADRAYSYDRWGNRTAAYDDAKGFHQIQSLVLQQSGGMTTNRLQSVNGVNYTYDVAGNVTNDGVHSYTYDSENRVVAVDSGTTANYAYNHQNQRYKTTAGSSLTHYIWQAGKVLAEHNGGTGTMLVNYLYAGSRPIAKIASGTTNYLLSDRLSVRLTLNTSGAAVVGRQAHLPYGEDFAESGTQQKQHFTSYERDSQSGTDYAGNRNYAAAVGRFQSADPFEPSADASVPQSWNRYTYVMGSPVDFVDPSGLNVEEPTLPEPCHYEPDPPPPKRCHVTLGARGLHLNGDYHIGGHFASATTIGPVENPVEDGFWGYVDELRVQLPKDDKDPAHWVASRIVLRMGNVTILYNGNPYDVSKNLGPEPDGPGESNEDWTKRGWLFVVDTPDIRKIASDPKGNGQKVVSGHINWTFTFNVKNTQDPRRSCAAILFLTLTITDGNPAWSARIKSI